MEVVTSRIGGPANTRFHRTAGFAARAVKRQSVGPDICKHLIMIIW